MAQTRSRSDLVTEALANLGALSASQPPATEDLQFIDEKLESIMDGLAAREVVYVPDLSAIPNQWFDSLAAIVADACKSKFGVGGDDVTMLLGNAQKAEMDLKVMTRGKPTFEPLRPCYI
jgi:hypothetical protein